MKLKVVAVQLNDLQSNEDQNALFARAAALVERAAKQGAELICFPECAFGGFVFAERIWKGAESWTKSPTLSFLKRCATKWHTHVGAGMLVAEGDHFRNVWVLVNPSGEIAERVYKSQPASMESNFFTSGDCGRAFDVPGIGKIAVAICYENFLASVAKGIYEAQPDLVIAPFSAPRMDSPFPLSESADAWFCGAMAAAARDNARAFGVPCVAVNKSGPWVSPMVGVPLVARTVFGGRSAIAGREGEVAASLGEAPEDVIVAEVELGPRPGGPLGPRLATAGRFSRPLPWQMRTFPLHEFLGARAYAANPRRAAAARAAQGLPPPDPASRPLSAVPALAAGLAAVFVASSLYRRALAFQ